MNKDRINKLLEKYWEAESSLEEEKELRVHFSSDDMDSSVEAALFAYFEKERSKSLERTIDFAPTPKRRVVNMRYIFSIAASVAILTLAYIGLSPGIDNHNPNHTLVEDPEEALKITLDALSLVNGQMAKGEATVRESMQHLDKTFIFKS